MSFPPPTSLHRDHWTVFQRRVCPDVLSEKTAHDRVTQMVTKAFPALAFLSSISCHKVARCAVSGIRQPPPRDQTIVNNYIGLRQCRRRVVVRVTSVQPRPARNGKEVPMVYECHADGATIHSLREIECKRDPGFAICTGRMCDQALRADLRRRRRRSAHERSHHVAYPLFTARVHSV